MRRLIFAVAVSVLALAGCRPPAGAPAVSGGVKEAGKARGGAEARLPEEKAVLAYLLDSADDPGSVQVASWGPHDLKSEAISWGPDTKGEKTIRVRLRAKNPVGAMELYDKLVVIRNGKVAFVGGNQHGDEWIAVRKKEKEELNLQPKPQ